MVLWQAICCKTLAVVLHDTIMLGLILPTAFVSCYIAMDGEVMAQPPCSPELPSGFHLLGYLKKHLVGKWHWHEACCHVLLTDTWQAYLLCWDTSFDVTREHECWRSDVYCLCYPCVKLMTEEDSKWQSVCVFNIRVSVWCVDSYFKELFVLKVTYTIIRCTVL